MSNLSYLKSERIRLKGPEYNEKWVHDQIDEDTTILGLGKLDVIERERIQPRGRLDLLLGYAEVKRYEVEIQLGTLDESHIIRAIEYWDIERRREPQYDHCAVIIAEDVTGRFYNVVSFLNRKMPLIAIQMQALKVGGHLTLVFTTVVDEYAHGDRDAAAVPTDRTYWEQERGTKETVKMVDQVLELIRDFGSALKPKYNKRYIGLVHKNRSDGFAIFRPQRVHMLLETRLEQSEEIDKKIDDAGLNTLAYDTRWGRYRIRLSKGDIKKHGKVLHELMKMAFERQNG